MKTGFTSLDKLSVDLVNGNLTLIGARPGMGKTAFALNIAINAAGKNKIPVHVFAFEETTEKIVSRVLTYCPTFKDLSICKLPAGNTVDVLINEVRKKFRQSKKTGVVVIDCLQRISGDGNSDKNTEIHDIIRKLKLLTIELQVPVICCIQLPQIIEYRKNNRPRLSDLRSMGYGEQDADMVMFLYRDNYYNCDYDNAKDTAEIIVAKNRYGNTGAVEIGWDGEHLRFYDKIGKE